MVVHASDSQAINKIYMNSAVNEAKAVAYKEAKVPYKRTFNGIYVMSVQENSNFKNKLRVGDTVTAVDDKQLALPKVFKSIFDQIRSEPR